MCAKSCVRISDGATHLLELWCEAGLFLFVQVELATAEMQFHRYFLHNSVKLNFNLRLNLTNTGNPFSRRILGNNKRFLSNCQNGVVGYSQSNKLCQLQNLKYAQSGSHVILYRLFQTSSTRYNPLITIVLRQVAKIAAALTGRLVFKN